ncbi:MAG: cobalt transporter CbiM [Deltaproteobacteria bacterium]|nr:cobalt transporter CbiM [Deltaproteobacteria bacterium]
MHITEGILTGPVLLTGAALTAAGTAVGLKRLDYDSIPGVAILSAGFFVASLIHVPVGPASAHLVLNGLVGIMLGWLAFPAILIGLLLQAILFQFGGFTTLGVNTLNMALPALLCRVLFKRGVKSTSAVTSSTASFMCGFMALFLSSIMVGLSLYFTGEQFLIVSKLIVVSNMPIMLIEGIVTLFCIRFLKKVKPDIFEVQHEKQ